MTDETDKRVVWREIDTLFVPREAGRRGFNPNDPKDRELSADIRKHGVTKPLLVRPHGDAWMIVDGARRWSVAIALNFAMLPCVEEEDG